MWYEFSLTPECIGSVLGRFDQRHVGQKYLDEYFGAVRQELGLTESSLSLNVRTTGAKPSLTYCLFASSRARNGDTREFIGRFEKDQLEMLILEGKIDPTSVQLAGY